MPRTLSTPVPLHYRVFGDGPPLVILHGLFGCWHNWSPVARALSDRFRVLAVDQRNHGESGHAEPLDYERLCDDLRSLLDELGLPRVALLGHSMGGKAAMLFADRFPERVDRLIVVDIGPGACPPVHRGAIEALCELELNAVSRLKDAERLLAPAIPDAALRLFLLKNLARSPAGVRWKVGLGAIRRGYEGLCAALPLRGGQTPALFVCGGRSEALPDADWPAVQRIFPHARRVVIPEAGHWVHADDEPGVLSAVRTFLEGPA